MGKLQFLRDKELEKFNDTLNTVYDLATDLAVANGSDAIDNSEITSDVIDELVSNKYESADIERLLENVSVPQDRIQRYQVYDEIVSSIPLVKRILRVYNSNILQKNPVDNKFYTIKKKDASVDDSVFEKQKQLEENIIRELNLERKLRYNIVPMMLKYGDVYVEVIDVDRAYNKQMEKPTQISALLNEEQSINTLSNLLLEEETPEESAFIKFNKVILRIHHPKNIIKIEDRYGNLFGYVEVVEQVNTNKSISIQQLFTRVVGSSSTTPVNKHQEEELAEKLTRAIIKQIYTKHINPSQTSTISIDTLKEFDKYLSSLDPEVYSYLKRLIIDILTYNRKASNKHKRIRFIPSTQMFEYTIPSSDYYPYGQSIVDPLILPSKLLLLSQLANVVSKLSRAALVRKWIIDVGYTEMHSQLIQRLKRELYNTRVTIDSLNSFKSIANILSDFKDMFILSKNGQRSVDVEVSSMGDPSVKVADIQDSRNEIMTLSGIPAVYLGADAPELREALVHSNTVFASEISDLQGIINNTTNKLLSEISKIVYGEPLTSVRFSLIPPVVLILQLIEMTLGSIGNIAGVFSSLQIPFNPWDFLEKYVPYEDWSAFRKSSEKFMQDKLKEQQAQAEFQQQMQSGSNPGF